MCRAQLNARCIKFFMSLFTASSPPQLVDGADGLTFTGAGMEAFRVTAPRRLTEWGGSNPGIRALQLALLHEAGPPRSALRSAERRSQCPMEAGHWPLGAPVLRQAFQPSSPLNSDLDIIPWGASWGGGKAPGIQGSSWDPGNVGCCGPELSDSEWFQDEVYRLSRTFLGKRVGAWR